jgi:hypothetical protein
MEAVLLEGHAGSITSSPATAIHQIGVLFLESPQPHLDVGQGHVDGVGNTDSLTLPLRTHVHNHELWVVQVLVDHLLGLGRTHCHSAKYYTIIGKIIRI